MSKLGPLVRGIRRVLGGRQGQDSVTKFLQRPTDLPSVEQFIAPHVEHLKKGVDMKGMFTSDPATVKIGQDVLQQAGTSDFFRDKIFSQPQYLTEEKGSIKVGLADIRDFPRFRRLHAAKRGEDVMLAVGGPAAEDQVVMASVISQIRDRLKDILYVTRDYKESNVNHAAKQSHARHGNALNADQALTGHALLPMVILRKLIGVDVDEVVQPDFVKIDVKLNVDFNKLRIYFGNELNWLKQEWKKYKGELTEHDINRIESVLSQEILQVMEDETSLKISGRKIADISDSSSIHVAFSEKNSREIEHENANFAVVGIKASELTPEEIDFFFTKSTEISRAWKYYGDTHIKFDAHEHNKELAVARGARWIEGKEVSKVLLIPDAEDNAQFAGVVTKGGEYIYANKMHFTGGYKVDFVFDKDSSTRFESSFLRNAFNAIEDLLDAQKPIVNEMTTSTGVSINAVFRKSAELKKVIEKYGSTGEIAVTNSHWTMIAQDENYIVMRMTGGGNTGSEEYSPAYFLNVLANTRRIFGDDLIGILSTYGCPRAINSRNSTEFAQIAEGAVVSYGKGGTGNTKRHAEAAIALSMLGFGDEVKEHFNQFAGREGEPLGDKIQEVYKHLKDVKFIHDNVKRVNRRMGYDDSISIEEMIVAAIVVAAVAYVASKAIQKEDKKDEKSELPASQIKPQQSNQVKINDKQHEA